MHIIKFKRKGFVDHWLLWDKRLDENSQITQEIIDPNVQTINNSVHLVFALERRKCKIVLFLTMTFILAKEQMQKLLIVSNMADELDL